MQEPIISLCLPTNGIIEWVFPVLDSIYSQKIAEDLFEVVVTNNGENDKFDQLMLQYVRKHKNMLYRKTDAYMFHNQLEALTLASGKYLKLINHRGVFTDNALKRLINIVNDNIAEKPVIYFSNGVMKKESYMLNSFDEFVNQLGRFASWTTGVGIWKTDYDKIREKIKPDNISPHSCILFSERKKDKYLIYNFVFSNELKTDQRKKGKYDLFKAFAVEEVSITLNLLIDGDITVKTFKNVKKDYRRFVSELYFTFVVRRIPCSYDLSGFDNAMGVFFRKYEIKLDLIGILFVKSINKMIRIMRKK